MKEKLKSGISLDDSCWLLAWFPISKIHNHAHWADESVQAQARNFIQDGCAVTKIDKMEELFIDYRLNLIEFSAINGHNDKWNL